MIIASLRLLGLCAPLMLGGCLFDEKKEILKGERQDVLPQDAAEAAAPHHKVSLSSPSVNTTWQQAGGNAQHTLHHPALNASLTKLWSAPIGRGSGARRQLIAAPVASHDRIYTIDATAAVQARNLKTGAIQWKKSLSEKGESGIAHGGLALDHGVLYIATGFAQLIALDASTGTQKWVQHFNAPLRSAPTVDQGLVFVMTSDNQMHACAVQDGQIKWSQMGLSETTGVISGASPAVSKEFVVFGHSSGDLTCHRIENGTLLWDDNLIQANRMATIAKVGSVKYYPVISGSDVFAVGNNGRLVSIDINRGTATWDRPLNGYGAPVLDGDHIFTVTYDGKLMCLKRADGETEWVTPLKAYAKDKDRSTRILWTTPLLAGGRLFLGSSAKELVEVDATTGKIIRALAFPAPILISPIVVDKKLIVLTDAGTLSVFG